MNMKVIEQLKSMDNARFLAIYEALAQKGFGPLDGEVAKAMKFRPHAIVRLPMAKRAQTARNIMLRNGQAELCYELFGSYLFATNKQLVLDFLDGTGVAHEDGMISNTQEAEPDATKVAAVVQELDGKYEPADVTLYLAIAAEQWPGVAEVESAWRMRG